MGAAGWALVRSPRRCRAALPAHGRPSDRLSPRVPRRGSAYRPPGSARAFPQALPRGCPSARAARRRPCRRRERAVSEARAPLAQTPTFPLVSRWRLVGQPFGELAGARKGSGSDVAGARPYEPGDDVAVIDWNASARLSLAHDADEFVVREHYAEEAPKVVIVCDRRPAMAVFGPELPWLSKPLAMTRAAESIAASALIARGLIGSLDMAGDDTAEPEPFWIPPRSKQDLALVEMRLAEAGFDAPDDNLSLAFDQLVHARRDLPPGSFVFVISDFLEPPPLDDLVRLEEHRWDVVPVVIQDPVWEQSFPRIPSLLVPVADPRTGRIEVVRISAREARRRRRRNEARLRGLLDELRVLGLEPVVLGSSEPASLQTPFLSWAQRRAELGRGTWV
ncbi:MAG: DUF58 domain-containing protein [Solirubrobacterales bacterium]|nr:DUF58 domain-containing protein [Solirubrobacterales bacterium]